MRLFTALLFVLGAMVSATGQNAQNFWTSVRADDVFLPANSVRDFEPKNYRVFRLDLAGFKSALQNAPMEFATTQKTLILQVPQADGSLEPFSIRESPVMMAGLQAKYPNIRTYYGQSVQTPGKIMRFTVSPDWGIEAMIRHEDYRVEYVEPMALNQTEWYRAYDRRDFPQELRARQQIVAQPHPDNSLPANAAVGETPFAPELEMEERGLLDPVQMKLYRFAVGCTGEFSQDHGGTVPAVLAKVVGYTNKMNIVYEADLDIRLILVDDEDKLIFLDPVTDPYTGSTVGQWAGQNGQILNTYLGGFDKYDLGHCFARYLGGDAAGVAGGLCCTLSKAAGCSSGTPPYGDGFLDIPGQEIGHQWAGGHTWNYCTANNQWSQPSACEPGSGSTVMSYAGACGQYNVATTTDLYYQACSIVEIRDFVKGNIGSTCGSVEATTNNAPIATHPYQDNFFIPILTPFELKGSATDPDGDTNLTYIWDETDTGPYTPPGQPLSSCPLFRSWPPSTKTNRVFPRIQTIVLNQNSNAEQLPGYTRDMNFRFVVRDNHVPGGGVGYADLVFKTTDKAGPFLVTSPNVGSDRWTVGDYTLVTWDVANTDQVPVSCKTVNILLSTDGGYNYPTVLASNIPNTGVACVLVPDKTSIQARIRIEAADNIFFDISNANFRIEDPTTPGFAICGDKLKQTVCAPTTFTSQVSTSAVGTFSSPITFTAAGLPAGTGVAFNPATVNPGETAELRVDFPADLADGTYSLTVTGTANGLTETREYTFVYFNANLSGLTQEGPADGATGVAQSPTLTWKPLPYADKYDVELATSPSFAAGTIVASQSDLTATSYQSPIVLDKGKVYFWRVRAKNECGESAWSDAFAFSTLVESCATLTASDLPKTLAANGTPSIEIPINIPAGGTVSDVNVKQVKGFHESFKQLELHLVSPQGTDVLLFKNKCGSLSVSFNLGVDDASTAFPCPPPLSTAQPTKPQGSLAMFNGQSAAGNWKLVAKDNEAGSGGVIEAFQLELCAASALNPPFIVNNNILSLLPGVNALISNDLLKADDANNTPPQLTFTLITVPADARIEINGQSAAPGSTFTQAELDNGAVRLFDYGTNHSTYSFRFIVTDGEGGMVSGTFTIQPLPVGTNEAANALRFRLAPNPATETVQLTFGEATPSDTRVSVFNAAGQLVQNRLLAAGQTAMTLDVAALPEGIYMVAVENEKGRGVRKLVVR